MKKIVIFNRGNKVNEFEVENKDARRLALAIANREHNVRDYFDEIIGCNDRGEEITIVKIKSVESA